MTVVFVDESEFYLLPGRVATYAPRGQTPILRWPIARDRLSVSSAVTMAGRLFTRVSATSLTSAESVAFLRHVQRHVGGKLMGIRDGSPIHQGEVRRFLAKGRAQLVHGNGCQAMRPT